MKWLIFSTALLALFGVTLAVNVDDALPDWVYENLTADDRLLCVESPGNDMFFVARSGDRVKVGSFLDVDEGLGYPLSFVTSLRFMDQDGEALGAPHKPDILKEHYVKVKGEYFAERIAMHHIYEKDLRSIQVVLLLKKYTDDENVPGQHDLKDVDLRTTFECRSEWGVNAE